jgi:hypothetical protein
MTYMTPYVDQKQGAHGKTNQEPDLPLQYYVACYHLYCNHACIHGGESRRAIIWHRYGSHPRTTNEFPVLGN